MLCKQMQKACTKSLNKSTNNIQTCTTNSTNITNYKNIKKVYNNNMLYTHMQKVYKKGQTSTNNSNTCTTNATNIPNK